MVDDPRKKRAQSECKRSAMQGTDRPNSSTHPRINQAFASSCRGDHAATSDCAATTGSASVWAGGSVIEVVSRDLR